MLKLKIASPETIAPNPTKGPKRAGFGLRLSLVLWVPLLNAGCSTAAHSDNFPAGNGPSTSDQTSSETQSTESSSSSNNSSSLPEDSSSETAACTEGERRSCNERPDGSKLEFPGGVAQGSCKQGHQSCKNGQWEPCQDAIGPKPEDRCDEAGNDDNCNAIPNEGCECTDDKTPRSCGSSEVGACKLGLQSCVDGRWQKCVGEVKAQPELCDNQGIDEDCDGKVDLQDEDCECIDRDQELCSLPGKGDCSLGKRLCKSGKWAACEPRFARAAHETCGELQTDELGSAIGDEDCDGKVDNHPKLGPDPIHCQFYMIDRDGDGFGAIGANYRDNQVEYSYGCFCKGKAPNKDMVIAFDETYNQDCGDCEVDGELVNPSVTEYFDEPSSCLASLAWTWGPYDYNCSEEEEQAHSSVATCEESEAGTCIENAGHWSGSVPYCGELGRLGSSCLSEAPPCKLLPPLQVERQACR